MMILTLANGNSVRVNSIEPSSNPNAFRLKNYRGKYVSVERNGSITERDNDDGSFQQFFKIDNDWVVCTPNNDDGSINYYTGRLLGSF